VQTHGLLPINRAGDAVVERFFPTGSRQTHHLAPAPAGKFPHSGCGVTKSFPCNTEKSRKSRVTLGANGVQPNITGAGATVAVAIESG